MGREIQRVPLNFDWPLHKEWKGWLSRPWDNSFSDEHNEAMDEQWYENERYDPPEGEGWQVWETVSEGSPIGPVFATSEELVAWIVSEGHTQGAAKAFVRVGYVPSMIVVGGVFYTGIDAAPFLGGSEEG